MYKLVSVYKRQTPNRKTGIRLGQTFHKKINQNSQETFVDTLALTSNNGKANLNCTEYYT